MKTNLNNLRNALKVKKLSTSRLVLCPAHNDHNPSLSIKVTSDGKILWHCFAGCSQQEVYKALKERGLLSSKLETRRNK
jgi:DNA primase